MLFRFVLGKEELKILVTNLELYLVFWSICSIQGTEKNNVLLLWTGVGGRVGFFLYFFVLWFFILEIVPKFVYITGLFCRSALLVAYIFKQCSIFVVLLLNHYWGCWSIERTKYIELYPGVSFGWTGVWFGRWRWAECYWQDLCCVWLELVCHECLRQSGIWTGFNGELWSLLTDVCTKIKKSPVGRPLFSPAKMYNCSYGRT